ncbi:MAG: NADPH-dependent FMN reductase [Caulobacter sp.]
MRLLGVSGSLRAASFNSALLNEAADLLPEGVSLERFGLHDLPLFNADVEAQGDPEPVTAWKAAVRAADGILFACPEYNAGITGVLKNAIDWASRGGGDTPAPLTGQIACIFGASPGVTGSARAQDQLRLVLRRTVTTVAPIGEVLVFQAHTKITDGRLTDERTREAFRRHLAGFAEAVRAHRA